MPIAALLLSELLATAESRVVNPITGTPILHFYPSPNLPLAPQLPKIACHPKVRNIMRARERESPSRAFVALSDL